MEYNCPNCGAPIKFSAGLSIYTTCTFCRSNIVRHDKDLEKIGEVSELLQDMSPFQVGTSGRFDGMGFTLLGRIKVGYPTGMWSEWYALFDDGRQAWLAEAQGYYMLSFPYGEMPDLRYDQLRVNRRFTIEGVRYVVEDRREIRYLASEGELPFVFEQGFKALSIDLRGQNQEFVNLLRGPQGNEVFKGRYVDFDEFEFKMLRQIDGWDA